MRPMRPSRSFPSFSTAELRHVALTEDVVHLEDVLMRRTSLAFQGLATRAAAAEIARAIAPALGWDDARVEAETARGIAGVHAADPTWDAASVTAIA